MASTPKRLRRGLFVVFEGIDGAGKSSQIQLLRDYLQEEGYRVTMTREPTADSPAAEQLRAIAARGREGVTLEQELQLFLADRRHHVDNVILPALRAKDVVLCDRYYFSTIAYQGALGLDPETVRGLNEETHCFPAAHVVIYLRIDPEAGLRRIHENREGGANAGYEKADFLSRVAAIYDTFREEPHFHTVDADAPLEEVQSHVRRIVVEALPIY